MEIKKTVTKQILETTDYICNKCGNSCVLDTGNAAGMIKGFVRGGYDSPYLEDLTNYSFCLCEKCLVELFEAFKIPVDKEEEII